MENSNRLFSNFINSEYRITKSWEPPLELGENSLRQIGMTFFSELTHIPSHTHSHINTYELTAVMEGEGTILINNTPVTVKKNDICLTMPFDKHEIISSKQKPLRICNIAFCVSGDKTVCEYNKIYRDFHCSNMRVFSDNIVYYLLGLILNEIHNEIELNIELISSLLNSIIIYIIKCFNGKSNKRTLKSVTNQEILCFEIMNYIDTNILTMKNLYEISNFTSYSYPYISSLFKKITKMSLNDYYTDVKFKKANELLYNDKLSVNKVAEMLNYSSSNAFTKAYKNKFGTPPTKKQC